MATVERLFENTIIIFCVQSTIGRISCAILLFHIFRFKFLTHNTLCDTWTSAVLVLSVFTEQIRHVLFDLAQLCGSKLLQSQSKKIKLSIKLKKKKILKLQNFLCVACGVRDHLVTEIVREMLLFFKQDPLLCTA